MKRVIAIGGLALVLLAATCGGDGGGPSTAEPGVPMFRGDSARTGENPGPGVERPPSLLWRFQTGGWVDSSPAVVDGVVYIGSQGNHVYALDAATGEERWRFQTGGWVDSSPAVVEGVVYIGSEDNHVYSLHAATGEERWRFETRGWVESSPAVVEGVVYVGSNDSYVYALDAATGEERWRFQTGGWVDSSPAVVDDVVYIGSEDNYVYALHAATGEERWRFQTRGWVDSSPAVVDGIVYVGSNDSYVYALDAATGEERWRFETGDNVSSPAVMDGVVYISVHAGPVIALDAATGEQRWRSEMGGFLESSPAVVEGVVYIGGDIFGYISALDAATGEERWRFDVDFADKSSPVVVDSVVYIGNVDGYVYAISQGTGDGLAPSQEHVEEAPRIGEHHWHATYQVFICGDRQPNFLRWDVATIDTVRTSTGIHTHGDGVIHIHPLLPSEEGQGARLIKFFESGDGKLNQTEMRMPGSREAFNNGDVCPDGSEAVLQVFVNGERLDDWAGYIPQDGDRVRIVFGPPDAELSP